MTIMKQVNNMTHSDMKYNLNNFSETIHHIFKDTVEKYPNKIAVAFEEQSLSYKQLDQQSNQLAYYLQKLHKKRTLVDLKPDMIIAIALDRGLDMIICILGVLKSGCAYVPIDINDPVNRIQHFVKDTNSIFILTKSIFKEKLKALENKNDSKYSNIVLVDRITHFDDNHENLKSISKFRDLAYVIYTSGTTGRPKGIMIEHRSVVNLALSRKIDFSIDFSSVVLQFSPITFDASVCEIFSALLNGAKLVIIPEYIKRDPVLLIKFIKNENITVATILPSLLAKISLNSFPDLPNLATLIVAGEACTQDVMLQWSKNRQLINAYGPSEVTVCATVHKYKKGDISTTIGSSIKNTSVYILDEKLNPVGNNNIGELYIGGIGLARGYLNQQGLTNERFIYTNNISTSESNVSATRLYKTGDLARYIGSDLIEYVGRSDFQIKIRGHRIELGELESILLCYPGIRQVCVVAKENKVVNSKNIYTDNLNNNENKFLVVYYVSNISIQSTSLVLHLSDKLPKYMIPNYFIGLKEFPLTKNGKIDRDNLPDPRQHNSKNTYLAPENEFEIEIFNIWKSILGFNEIGINEDFFEIGGNSLLMISLVSLINFKFNIKITISSFSLYRTISSQARFIKENKNLRIFQPISKFQTKGKKEAIFFIHPSMTGADVYKKMSNWFDLDQPFYGVESYNFHHLEKPELCLHALAKRYIKYIREVQSTGPYLLAGYSLGGNIAFEIAQQLITMGESVNRIYLIDSVLPSKNIKKTDVTYSDARNFLEYFNFKDTDDKKLLELAKIEMSLLFNYYPKYIIPIKLILIKAKNLFSPLNKLSKKHVANHFFQIENVFSGWDYFVKEVNQYEIDANHETILESNNLEKVARIIQNDINLSQKKEMLDLWS